MSAPQNNLATESRLRWMADELSTNGSFTVAGAAAQLDVSEMTIRRDLVELEERGVARRVRGGALPLGPQSFSQRTATRSRAKARIAARVAELVPSTGTVALDASSTVMRAASALTGADDLVVLTNGPDTFVALHGRPGIRPILTGGQLDPRTGSLVGPVAAWTARQVAPTQFVMSCAALDTDGPTEQVLEEAEIKGVLAGRAAQVVLAVDSSKLGGRMAVRTVGWEAIDTLVTELDPTDRRLNPFRNLATII